MLVQGRVNMGQVGDITTLRGRIGIGCDSYANEEPSASVNDEVLRMGIPN
jgi:hypothetical protein